MLYKSRFIRNEYFGISGLRCGFQFKLDGLYNSKPDGTEVRRRTNQSWFNYARPSEIISHYLATMLARGRRPKSVRSSMPIAFSPPAI